MQGGLAEKKIVYLAGDFAVADERIDDYFREYFDRLAPQGLILASYIAPATALYRGKYSEAQRDIAKTGLQVYEAVHRYIKEKRAG